MTTRRRTRKEEDEIEFASCMMDANTYSCLLIATEYGDEHAALTLGWELEKVKETLRSPEARLFMQKAQDKFVAELAKSKLRQLRKVDISPGAVEERLMELAQLDPSQTKGTIDGQVKALRTLAETLGMLGATDDPLRGKTRADLEGIIASVRTKAGMLAGGSPDPVPEY
jgi:hypothetical protein